MSGLTLRHVFNWYSKIFNSFMDNSGLFNNNFLVEKYSIINLDKVQIIHNFIVIQLSPLFPRKQSYLLLSNCFVDAQAISVVSQIKDGDNPVSLILAETFLGLDAVFHGGES